MPIIRTFAPVVAGISHMDHKKFTFFNFIGGTLWVWAVSLAGYFLGSVIPNIDKYILPVVVIIILASTLPPIYHFYRESHKSLGELFKEKVLWFFKYKL
jgi:membrane-associated protein